MKTSHIITGNGIAVVCAVLALFILVPVACSRVTKENKIIEMISENCEPTGKFGVLTSGDSFAMYDCKEKKEADQ